MFKQILLKSRFFKNLFISLKRRYYMLSRAFTRRRYNPERKSLYLDGQNFLPLWYGIPSRSYYGDVLVDATRFVYQRGPWVLPRRWQLTLKKLGFKKYKLFNVIKRRRIRRYKYPTFFHAHWDLEWVLRERRIPIKKDVIRGILRPVVQSQITFQDVLGQTALNFIGNWKKTTTLKIKRVTDFMYNLLALKRKYLYQFVKQKRAWIRNRYIPGARIIVWASAGKLGFRSNKRTSPYANELVGKYIGRYLKRRRVKFIILELRRSLTPKMRAFLKGFTQSKFKIMRIYYKRKVMFGSLRKPKQRRV